jgi:hypothetical protein
MYKTLIIYFIEFYQPNLRWLIDLNDKVCYSF